MNRLILTLCLMLPSHLFGAIGDILSVGIEAKGWVAQVTVDGFTTNSLFNAFLTGSNQPTASTPYIAVNSWGYNDVGARSIVQRKVYMTALLRCPYPAQAFKAVSVSGTTNAMYRLALSETIYTGDSNLVCWIVKGVFTNATATNAAVASMSVSNGTAQVYPRVLAAWTDYPYRLAGSNYTVRCKAAHISAQQFRPVRLVEFWAMDAAGNITPTQRVTRPTIDWSYGDAVPVSEYVATLSYANLAQGSQVSNYFQAFPWWGNALSAADGVNALTSPDYAPFVVTCDKSNLWNAVYAIVDPNGSANGKAVTNLTQATNGTALPFATLAQAINAVGATNNAIYGSNTLENCFVLCTNGDYAIWGGDNITTRNLPCTWLTVKPRPDVSWTTVNMSNINNKFTMQRSIAIRFEQVNWTWTAFDNPLGEGYGRVCIDRCRLWTNTTSGKLIDYQTNAWIWRTQIDNQRGSFAGTPSILNSNTRMRGNTLYQVSDASVAYNPCLFIGNRVAFVAAQQFALKNDVTITNDPFIWADNVLFNCDADAVTVSIGIETHINIGALFANNVLEVGENGGQPPLDVMYSQKDNENCTNVLIWNNTVLAVYHPPYNLAGKTNVTTTSYSDLNNILANYSMSCDINDFTGANSADTNRWDRLYCANNSGNVVSSVGNAADDPQAEGVSGNYGFGGLSYGRWTNDVSIFNFTLNASSYFGTDNGNGNYRLRCVSPVFPFVTMQQPLSHDVEGLPRGLSDPPGAYASGNVRKSAGFW